MENHSKRDRTARFRIRRFLASQGPVSDPSGYATGILKDSIDYQGTSVAFIQLVAAMERDGEIVREIRGKRTYRISLSTANMSTERMSVYPTNNDLDATDTGSVDYQRLAQALVRELLENSRHPIDVQFPGHQQSVEQLRAERDEYAARLDLAQRRLRLLLGDEVVNPIGTLTGGIDL